MKRSNSGWSFNGLAFAALFTLFSTLSAGCSSGGLPPQPGSTAPGPGTAPAVSPGSIVVSIPAGAVGLGAAAYGANPLIVNAGSIVTWVNNDSLPHTVTADDGSFDSGPLQPGQTFQHTFATAGTYPYHCAIYGKDSMSGTVQVN